MAGRTGGPRDDKIHDRRGAPRLWTGLPVVLRDAAYAWRAEIQNISSSGCLLKLQNSLPVGKQLDMELKPQGRDAVRLRGSIVHVQPGQLAGFSFNTANTEDFERALDLFESLLAQQPGLAVEVRKRPVSLARSTMLWAMPDTNIQPRPEEARFLTLFVGGRTLEDAEKILGPRFGSLMYLAFSLLDRKLLSLVQPGRYG